MAKGVGSTLLLTALPQGTTWYQSSRWRLSFSLQAWVEGLEGLRLQEDLRRDPNVRDSAMWWWWIFWLWWRWLWWCLWRPSSSSSSSSLWSSSLSPLLSSSPAAVSPCCYEEDAVLVRGVSGGYPHVRSPSCYSRTWNETPHSSCVTKLTGSCRTRSYIVQPPWSSITSTVALGIINTGPRTFMINLLRLILAEPRVFHYGLYSNRCFHRRQAWRWWRWQGRLWWRWWWSMIPLNLNP